MEQFILEIEDFCARTGSTPQRLLRASIGASWNQWRKWKDGSSSPTMVVADRVRAFMAAYPNPNQEYSHDNPTENRATDAA